MMIRETLYPRLSMMQELAPNIACIAINTYRDHDSGILPHRWVDERRLDGVAAFETENACMMHARMPDVYQCPEEIRELERVLEQDEVDEHEHQPWVAEPEQLVRRAHHDAPFALPGGVLRGHLVGQPVYDVLQLRPNQKQQLRRIERGRVM